jgi:hypothetical protein
VLIFTQHGGAILELKRIKEIGLAILVKHHAVLTEGPMRDLFVILQKEKAFDYSVIPEMKIKEFFDLIDRYLSGDTSIERYLREKTPLVWKAYLSKKSRKEEICEEVDEISKYTKIGKEELCEFFRSVKKIQI